MLGPFELLGELGRGGMGVVYRARDSRVPGEGRDVALKVLLHGIDSNPARVERFRREAIITAALVHPGIVRALNAGITNGRPWVSFELVDGAKTFQEVMPSLPVRRRAELIRDAARALGFAHERSVVHRDVKPANLLVDAAGRVRVTDFGLAAARGLAPLTQTGSLMGTPLWMSPEAASGRRDQLGPPSDVWGLGVILYEALTGTLPFNAATFVDLVHAITAAAPPAPRALAPGVDPALEAVCLRALQRDPARRYPDGDAMANDLDRALTSSSAASAATPAPVGRKSLLLVHLTLAVVGLASIAGLLLLRRRPPAPVVAQAPPLTPTPTPPPAPGPPEVVDESPDGVKLRALRYGAQRGDRDCLYGLARASLYGLLGVPRDPAAALPLLLQATALGNGSAANEIGGLWNEGRGVPKDERRAREWFKRAADLDDPEGMTNLGAMMSMGMGGARDLLQAVTLLKAAAERGSREAEFRLGLAFERGEGVDTSRTEAAAWYRRAADKDHPLSMIHLAKLLQLEAARRPEAREEALGWLRRAAELGDERARKLLAEAPAPDPTTQAETPIAQLRSAAEQGDGAAAAELGRLHAEGLRGVEKDPVQAESWLRRALDRGFMGASSTLASLLDAVTGERAEAARREALEVLRRGADAGDPASMTNLGHHYATVEGGARDEVQAAALFLRAAEAGESGGMRNLAVFLREGRGGLTRDPAQAVTWLRRSAEGGRVDAMVLLAEQLLSGLGCERDPKDAVRWLRLAAEKGDAQGMFLLAQQLHAGPPAAHPEASRWLLKAAAQNHVNALLALVRALTKGRGFTRRIPAAITYAQKAAALGSAEGLVLLSRLFDDLGREAAARELLEPAAKAGVPEVMFELARLLEHGRGGPIDRTRAASLRKRAADAGVVRALAAQARAVVAAEPSAALALWRRAAEAGHAGSMVELYQRLRTSDRATARAWLEKAAALGDAEAQLLIAAKS